MQTPDKDGPVQPVLIFDSRGELAGSALMNDKGFSKSLEQGELWTLDGTTGRLIPWQAENQGEGSCTLVGLNRESGWISAEIAPVDSSVEHSRSDQVGIKGVTEKSRKETNAAAEPASFEQPQGSAVPVLERLEQIIMSRKQQMPEGSYTTHLFSKGEDKIRKKTGEEAVELLLARDDNEMVSEAADLLYHLVVLFVQRGIPLTRIFEELQRR